jgi:hypothetical protein
MLRFSYTASWIYEDNALEASRSAIDHANWFLEWSTDACPKMGPWGPTLQWPKYREGAAHEQQRESKARLTFPHHLIHFKLRQYALRTEG